MDTTTNLEDLATAFEAAPLNSISHPLCRGCLTLIAEGKIELFADNIFPLTKVKKAFEALSGRRTIGEVDLNSVIKDGSHYVSKRSPMNLHVVSAEAEFEAEKPCGLPQLPVIRNVLPLLLLTWTSLVVSNAAQAGPNHLSGQVAPYLSHAISQPVDWYPSGTDAFKRARELNRPVLLDMGAVWCGWCDLMDRERYKRPDLATFINANFVAVKVDYEAQPQLAAELERAQAILNLPSGLPLTGFLTPAGKLYFGGTYFPRETKGNKPALEYTLEQALRMYREHRTELERDGVDLKEEK